MAEAPWNRGTELQFSTVLDSRATRSEDLGKEIRLPGLHDLSGRFFSGDSQSDRPVARLTMGSPESFQFSGSVFVVNECLLEIRA